MKQLAGDPALVLSTGQSYTRTAAAIRDAVRALNDIADPDTMQSIALSAVRGDAEQLAGDIAKAETRYSETGAALEEYAGALETAQADARRAIADYEDAVGDLSSAAVSHSNLEETKRTEAKADAPTPGSTTESDLARLASVISGLAESKRAAEQRYQQACDDRDAAANAAANRIDDVVDGSDLNDSVWDDIGGFFSAVVRFIEKVIEVIVAVIAAIVLAVLALIAAVVLLIAAVIALGLAIIALAVAAVIALAVLALALAIVVVLAVIAVAMVLGALAAAVLILGYLLARVAIFVAATVFLAATLIRLGYDPMDALVQAAITSLLVTVPELWVVIGLAGLQEVADPVPTYHDDDVPLPGKQNYQTLFDDLIDIDGKGHTNGDPSTNQDSVVRITTIEGPNGELIYKIAVPSTQQWSPGGTSANDVTSDVVAKMSPLQRTQLEKAVIDAMEAQKIPDGAHVMLTGWSLGGITAGNLAADSGFNSKYTVDAVITAGSSLDDMPIPAHTKVLDVSHTTDPVARTENPLLTNHGNDDNRYKINVPPPGGAEGDLGHNAEKYQKTFKGEVDGATSGPAYEFKTADGADDSVSIDDYFGPAVDVDDYGYQRG